MEQNFKYFVLQDGRKGERRRRKYIYCFLCNFIFASRTNIKLNIRILKPMHDVLFNKRISLIWHYNTVTDKKYCYKLIYTWNGIQFSSSELQNIKAKNSFYCISWSRLLALHKTKFPCKMSNKIRKDSIPYVSSKFLKSVLVRKKVLKCEDLVYFSFCRYCIWLFILQEAKSPKHSLFAVFFIIIQNSFII